ncbi:MAG: hydroxyacid dehydrogenase, partial [Candidatus Thermoplasmatota archaeon]|nr:hydroxyacid dehydrogenase [Candidatus Thermoplasmatota archaeon]
DVAYATKMGIPVVNAPTGSTNSVAELSLGLMFALARSIPWADKTTKDGKWEKKKLKGLEIDGKTLGLIGVGKIAQCLAKKAQALGMKTIGYDPYLPEDVARDAGVPLMEMDDVLRQSDYLSLHVVLTDETRGMINASKLGLMKPSACIINCARGGVIDEDALYQALSEKKLRGAALDVFAQEPLGESKLKELDNIILTPHIGAGTVEGQNRAGTIVVQQMLMVLEGKKPDHLVNRELITKWG